MKSHLHPGCALLVAALSLTPAAAAAQLTHPVPVSGPRVELSVAKPFLEDDAFGTVTGTLLARVTLPAGDGVSLFAEWGVSHATQSLDIYASPDFSDYADYSRRSGTATSSLVLGAAFGEADANSGSLLVSLPVAHTPRDGGAAATAGLFVDPDHLERFVEHVWAVEGALRSNHRLESGAQVGFRVAGALLDSTREGADAELYGRYGLYGSVPAGSAELGAEVAGVVWLSQSGLDLGERTYHHLVLSAGLPGARTAPQLFVRLPLDSDFGDVVKAVVGLRVTF